MMMSYRRRNKKFITIIFFVFILIILISVFNFVWPQSAARFIFSPMFSVREFVFKPFSALATSFKDKQNLENRIKELEDQNARLKVSVTVQNFVSRQIEDYNLELQKNDQGMISKVLNRPPYSPYDTLLILKGDHNIEVGDLVFIRGVYIGDVESVDIYTAVVKLRSASGEKTLVRIGDIEVEAEGKGGGQFNVRIPKDSILQTGDAVTVPLLNYSILGSVGQIIEDPLATFKTVYFSIPVAFQEMNFVSVVKKDSVLE